MEETGGRWNPLKPIRNFAKRTTQLTALSSESAVWQDGNTLWRLNVSTRSTTRIWESQTEKLEGFSCSRETGKLLLLCGDESGDGLWTFTPSEDPGKIYSTPKENLQRISAEANSVLRILPINNGEGVAYAIQDLGQKTFLLRTNAAAEPLSLFARGSVVNFTVSDTSVFVIGSLTNELTGIWQYNLSSRSLNCVYTGQEHTFKYAKYVVPSCEIATNDSGKEFTYHLWQPVRISSRRAPLIIGCSQYNWQAYPEVAANGGAFYVNVDRPSGWEFKDLIGWVDGVMAVYNKVTKDPRIDTRHVFLYGTSAETSPLTTLAREKPDLWKGLICFHAGAMPEPGEFDWSRILIDNGLDDETMKTVLDYQDLSTKAGVPVILTTHKEEGHILWSTSTERKKAQQFAKFVFGL